MAACYAGWYYRQVCNISRTWVGNEIVDHSYVVGASPVGAALTISSILHWTLGFNNLCEDNCKPSRGTFKFWDSMRLILEILRYTKHNACDYDMDVMATQLHFRNYGNAIGCGLVLINLRTSFQVIVLVLFEHMLIQCHWKINKGYGRYKLLSHAMIMV